MNPNEGSMNGFDILREMEMSVAPFSLTELEEIDTAAIVTASRIEAIDQETRLSAVEHLSHLLDVYHMGNLPMPPTKFIGYGIGATARAATTSEQLHDTGYKVPAGASLNALRRGLGYGSSLANSQPDAPFLDLAVHETKLMLSREAQEPSDIYRLIGIGAGYRVARERASGKGRLAA
jgi:hypothetical protein